MYLPKDPFKGLTPDEIIANTYGFNRSYDNDIVGIIEGLGDKDNIVKVRKRTDEDVRVAGSGLEVGFKEYKVEVVDFNKTGFANRDIDFRTVNGLCYIGQQDRQIITIGASRQMQTLMEEGCDYYKQNVLE